MLLSSTTIGLLVRLLLIILYGCVLVPEIMADGLSSSGKGRPVHSAPLINGADESLGFRCCIDCLDFDDFRTCNCSEGCEGNTTNDGTSFYLTFLQNAHDLKKDQEFILRVLALDRAANITVYHTTRNSLLSSTTVDPGGEATIRFTTNQIRQTHRLFSSMSDEGGLHVKSTNPVTLYAMNWKQYSTDAFLVLPMEMIGHQYFLVAFYPARKYQEAAIVATKDGTFVSVRLPWFPSENVIGDRVSTRPSSTSSKTHHLVYFEERMYQHGDVIVKWMSRLQTMLLQGDHEQVDFSGSSIVTNFPVAVFVGNSRASVPARQRKKRDHLVEQMLPTHMWGTRYVVASTFRNANMSAPRRGSETSSSTAHPSDPQEEDDDDGPGEGGDDKENSRRTHKGEVCKDTIEHDNDHIAIVCARANTLVTVRRTRCAPLRTQLLAGSSGTTFRLLLYMNDTVEVIANSSVSVTMFTVSSEDRNDPSMLNIPAIENYRKDYRVKAFERSGYREQRIVLAIERGRERGLLVNGRELDGVEWTIVGGVLNMVVGILRSAVSLMHISHAAEGVTFMCLLYGIGDSESYGLSAGYAFTNLPMVNSLSPRPPPNGHPFGPRAGGTSLLLTGLAMSRVQRITLQHRIYPDRTECLFTRENVSKSALSCSTNSAASPGPYEITMSIGQVPHQAACGVRPAFEYKENTRIDRIETKPKTFMSGGSQIMFVGAGMDSVRLPELVVIEMGANQTNPRIHHQMHGIPSCISKSATVLQCFTPPLNVSYSGNLRRKRDTLSSSTGSPSCHEGMSCGPEQVFYIGLHLDGIQTYTNLSESFGPMGSLQVADDPEFHDLDETMKVVNVGEHDTAWFIVKGSGLDSGADMSDYVVTVGDRRWRVVELNATSFRCSITAEDEMSYGDSMLAGENVTVDVTVAVGTGILHRFGEIALLYDPTPKPEPSQGSSHLVKAVGLWSGAGIGGAMVITLLVVGAYCCYVRGHRAEKKRRRKLSVGGHWDYFSNNHNSYWCATDPDFLQDNEPESFIPWTLLERGRVLGTGKFGPVYMGTYTMSEDTELQVALKSFKGLSESRGGAERLLEISCRLRHLSDTNVLPLLGCSQEEGECFLIFPLMPYGDVLSIVSLEDMRFSVGDLVFFAFQVAVGMSHLEDANIVHGDLCARNCMMDINWIVKVSDYGLVTAIPHSQRPDSAEWVDGMEGGPHLPFNIAWSSLEILIDGRYSIKGDVWSYGVVLWEFLTRGQIPYKGMSPAHIGAMLKAGSRLPKPPLCPPDVYTIMNECWRCDPLERPTFRSIVRSLGRLLFPDGQFSSYGLYALATTRDCAHQNRLEERGTNRVRPTSGIVRHAHSNARDSRTMEHMVAKRDIGESSREQGTSRTSRTRGSSGQGGSTWEDRSDKTFF